jgi:hypothetical protein
MWPSTMHLVCCQHQAVSLLLVGLCRRGAWVSCGSCFAVWRHYAAAFCVPYHAAYMRRICRSCKRVVPNACLVWGWSRCNCRSWDAAHTESVLWAGPQLCCWVRPLWQGLLGKRHEPGCFDSQVPAADTLEAPGWVIHPMVAPGVQLLTWFHGCGAPTCCPYQPYPVLLKGLCCPAANCSVASVCWQVTCEGGAPAGIGSHVLSSKLAYTSSNQQGRVPHHMGVT